jgi:hypothetical protein
MNSIVDRFGCGRQSAWVLQLLTTFKGRRGEWGGEREYGLVGCSIRRERGDYVECPTNRGIDDDDTDEKMNKSWFPGGLAMPLLCPHRSFRKQFVRHCCCCCCCCRRRRCRRQDAGRTLMVTGPPSVTDRRPPDGRTSAAVLSSYPTCSLPPTTNEDLPVRLPTGELSAPAPMCNRTLGT